MPTVQRRRRLPLEEPAVGVIMNYQRGSCRQRSQYGLIRLAGVTSSGQAAQYIGRSVILYFNEQTSITGRVIAVHGRGGVLRARFSRGLAADALAKEVKVF